MEGEVPAQQAAGGSIEWGLAQLDADGLAHWASKDFWRVYEAAHLLLGYAPDGRWYVEYSPLDIARKPPQRDEQPEHWKVWELYGRIKDAVDAMDLAALEFGGYGLDKVRPRDVVRWARIIAMRPGMEWLIVPDFPALARDEWADFLPPADWTKWAIRPSWKAWQACYLLSGLEPDNDVGPRPFEQDDPAEFLMRRTPPDFLREFYELLKSHAMAGTLPLVSTLADPAQFPSAYISRDALIAWAREHWDQYLPPELVAIFPSTPAPAPAVTPPAPAPEPEPQETAPAVIAILARWQTEPKLPFQTADELARTFAKVKAAGGAEINWSKETNQASKQRGGSLRLVDVERARRGAPWAYNPEGVAVWLHYTKGANLRDVGAVMYELVRKLGDEWGAKADAWLLIKGGEATLDGPEIEGAR